MPRIRASPEDFRVEEIPLYEATGEGEHTFLLIEKRQVTTDEVVRELARLAEVPTRDIGFAGRKDRNAVARQWLSVPGLDPENALGLCLSNGQVLQALRHRHKLRTAQLRGNRFEILVREVGEEAAERAVEIFGRLRQKGLPNRFGRQRFGRDGGNPQLGLAILQGTRLTRDRRRARFLVSALQSAVFNEVLARRSLPLDRVTRGDVALVHASGGKFVVEDVGRENERAALFEISATGPIFGTKMMRPSGEVAVQEGEVLTAFGVPDAALRAPLRGLRLPGSRRGFRARVEDGACARSQDRLELRFTLPAGSYATVLVEELFPGEAIADGPA